MRISLKWLSDYVAVPPAEELARRLTGVGLEVEAIERVGGGLDGVVVGKVLASDPHPNADKLSVTRIDAGSGEPLQIVCGAKNYKVGDLVPLATVGTKLPGGVEIKQAKLRGVESSGMLCSARELGLAQEASGLLILPPELEPGTPIAQALDLEDALFEVNVTPNRPDALSHIGIAREVAALAGAALRPPSAKPNEAGAPASDAVKVRIEAPEKCPRYAARVVEGIKIGPSPDWIVRRLERCGIRSISNVVDATNLVLLELGHPLHAFDLDKVAGREIVVRTARPGEKMITLDGKERALDADDLVIADRDRPSALAGIMGGGDSEISAGTTRVLLESAYFAPAGIRRSSRRHGLHTEASHRFERGADPGMVLAALDRCAALIAELAGGTVRKGIVDVHPRPVQAREVKVAWDRPGKVLGIDVPRSDVSRILSALGFQERSADGQGAVFQVPSWRVDVSLEEDLIEEIARSKGYDAIPETLPDIAAETPSLSPTSLLLARMRDSLEASGFSETINFAFVAPKELEAIGSRVTSRTGTPSLGVALKNPISAELAVMRTSLVPSLLRDAALNLRQRNPDFRLYEIASIFRPEPGNDTPVTELPRVAGLLAGRRSPAGWSTGSEQVDFYDGKGAVERLLAALGILDPVWTLGGEPWLHPRAAAIVSSGGTAIGCVGELHPRTAGAFDLPRGVFAFELSLDALRSRTKLVPRYHPVPRFPAVLRDLAVLVDDAVPADRVIGLVKGEGLVEQVTLFDVYKGQPIPEGKKNLAISIAYRAPDRTLTDAEVDAAHGRIVKRVASELGAELRG